MNKALFISVGSGPGLFLWPCGPLHLGDRNPGCWTEFHHDRHLLWAVCYGGKSVSIWECGNKMKISMYAHALPFTFFKGFLEPSVVPFCSGAADPLHRHHTYSAGRHFSGCSASDRDERLPQRASEHAGQSFNRVLTLWKAKIHFFWFDVQIIINVFSLASFLFFLTASICFDTDSDLHQSEIHHEWLCKRIVSEIPPIFKFLVSS